jgi:hypothetical protein
MSKKAEKRQGIEQLTEPGHGLEIRPTETLWVLQRDRSRSGMARWLDVYVIRGGELRRLTWSVAAACGFTYDKRREAIRIGGCGFSAAQEIASSLTYALWGKDEPEMPYREF